jgi:hypothetical protein
MYEATPFTGAVRTREIMEINKDLMAASSTPIVLAILAEGDSYGYAILQRVRELSGGRMEWTAISMRGGSSRRAADAAATTGSPAPEGLSSPSIAGSGKR